MVNVGKRIFFCVLWKTSIKRGLAYEIYNQKEKQKNSDSTDSLVGAFVMSFFFTDILGASQGEVSACIY